MKKTIFALLLVFSASLFADPNDANTIASLRAEIQQLKKSIEAKNKIIADLKADLAECREPNQLADTAPVSKLRTKSFSFPLKIGQTCCLGENNRLFVIEYSGGGRGFVAELYDDDKFVNVWCKNFVTIKDVNVNEDFKYKGKILITGRDTYNGQPVYVLEPWSQKTVDEMKTTPDTSQPGPVYKIHKKTKSFGNRRDGGSITQSRR
ncbi:MAG: hypothetical protein A2Y10_05175 [Planctomycetes bacterium GWF2_41_51]|nr:MAG: hypothetical protein A2Y10_05175 [Planctomycetes bacterium GWF2_41_51]HBG25544.1 hypothetical protein [Phycisphaerales bacterium]